MFKHALYVSTITTGYLICILIHTGVCDRDELYHRPSHSKYSTKQKTIASKISRSNVGNKFQPQAAIQYFDEESEELVGTHILDLARAFEKKVDDDYIKPNIPKTLNREIARDDKKTVVNYNHHNAYTKNSDVNYNKSSINKLSSNINLKKEIFNYDDEPQIKQKSSIIHMKPTDVNSKPHFYDREGSHHIGHLRESDVITEKPKHRIEPYDHSKDLMHIGKHDRAGNFPVHDNESKSQIGRSSTKENIEKKFHGRNVAQYQHPVQGNFEKRAFDSLETENKVFEHLQESKVKIERLISQRLKKHTTSSFSTGKSHILPEERSKKSEKEMKTDKITTYKENDISLNKKQKETTTDHFQSSHIKNNNKSKKENKEVQISISQILPHVFLKPRSETYINWDEPHSHKKKVSSPKSKPSHRYKNIIDWDDSTSYKNTDGDKSSGRQGRHKKKHVKYWHEDTDSVKGKGRQGEHKKKHSKDWDEVTDGDKDTGRQGKHKKKHSKDWDVVTDGDKDTGRQEKHKKKHNVKDWDDHVSYINNDGDKGTGRQRHHKKKHNVKDWDDPASYVNNDGDKGTGRQGDHKKKHNVKDRDDPASYINNDGDKGTGRQGEHKKARVTMIYNKLDESEEEFFHELSNEAPQTDSDEQKLGLRDDEKKITKSIRIHNEKVNANKENLRSPVRADAIADSKEFSPHSIARQLQCLSKKLKNDADIEQEIIGRTSEYNDLVLWKIKGNSDNSDTVNFRASDKKKKYADEPPEKKIVFIVHALSVMGFVDLDCLSKVERFKTLLGYYMDNLDKFDIYLIPMANPDGVAKNQQESWWNKNVAPQSACPGINVDRNFDVQWNSSYGKQMSSCSQNYPGVHAFSEPESQAVREVFHKYGHKIVGYFHVHAGTYDATIFKGDAVLYPKGYTSVTTDDDKYVDLKGDIDEAMRNTSFKVLSVTVDTLYNWYGKVLGTSVDYANTIYGIPYALELVMQIYEDSASIEDPCLRETNVALTEVWRVLIEVIFDSMYRNTVKSNQ